MARIDNYISDAAGLASSDNPEILYELGLMHAAGRDGEEDLITAHKWFNIAAFRGLETAKARREEIAAEMACSCRADGIHSAGTRLTNNRNKEVRIGNRPKGQKQ